MSYLVGNPKDRSAHRDYGGLNNSGVLLGKFFYFWFTDPPTQIFAF